MKIVIADIPEEGLMLDLEEKISVENVSIASPLKASLAISKVGNEIIVDGNLAAEMDLECSRCLKSFRQVQDMRVSVVYHPASEVGPEKHELHDDELDMGFYAGEEIDLDDLLREQIMLSVPMKPLCGEACRGICPKCGMDLNTGTCGCIRKETDPRLEVLKKLLDKGKE